jgi:hypothetical protein
MKDAFQLLAQIKHKEHSVGLRTPKRGKQQDSSEIAPESPDQLIKLERRFLKIERRFTQVSDQSYQADL